MSLVFSFLVLLLPQTSLAHPGRTAGDGCHYCRTNCSSWGEVYGARHCHGGYSPPVNTYIAPTSTPRPTATTKPTAIPTRMLTSTPTPNPTNMSTPTPQVLSSEDSNSENDSSSLITVGVIGVSGLGYYLYRKRKGVRNG